MDLPTTLNTLSIVFLAMSLVVFNVALARMSRAHHELRESFIKLEEAAVRTQRLAQGLVISGTVSTGVLEAMTKDEVDAAVQSIIDSVPTYGPDSTAWLRGRS